jgi:hypothetical protein
MGASTNRIKVVVRRVGPVRGEIAMDEVDVIESLFPRAFPGKRQRLFVDVDGAGHAAAAADQDPRQLSRLALFAIRLRTANHDSRMTYS